jgi:hypothetical protein
MQYIQVSFYEDNKKTPRKRILTSTNSVGEQDTHRQINEIGPFYRYKNQLKMDLKLICKKKTIKILKENVAVFKFLENSLGNDFLDRTSKADSKCRY